MNRVTVRFLAAAVLIFTAMRLTAQDDSYAGIPRTGFAYVRVGAGAGAPYAFRAGVDFVAKGRHELSLGYTGMSRKSPGVPSDAPEPSGLINLPIGRHPQELIEAFSIGYGYILYPKRNPVKNRYVFRASLLLGRRRDLTDVRIDRSGEKLRYAYGLATYPANGLLIEPGMQLITSRGFGWEFGPYAVFNDHICGAGISASMLLGYVSNYRHRPARP